MAREYTGKSINCIVRLNKIVFTKRNFNIISFNVIKNLTQDEIIKDKFGKITVSGVFNMDKIEEGVQYILSADEVKHEKYGLQYQVTAFKTNYPLVNEEDIKCFLSNIMTEKQFKNYCEAFKDELLLPLKNNDVELIVEKVSGFGATKAIKLIEKYNNNEEDAYILAKMTKFELTANDLKKLKHTYGILENAFKTIQENPYKLIRDIKGYGFKKADSIATMGGISITDIRRGQGFIEAYLYEEANLGSTRVDVSDLLEDLYNELGEDYPDESIVGALQGLEKEDVMWVSKDRDQIGLHYFRNMEKELALKLKAMMECKNTKVVSENWKDSIARLEKLQGWEYTSKQKEAIEESLNNNVNFIIGSAGTGKSSIVKGVREALGEKYTYLQTALSGKACENLESSTGKSAMTIHRFLVSAPNLEKKPDIVIIDEISMCGIDLLYRLILSLDNDTKLFFLGDKKQLPSIGVGNFLTDCMNSGVIPVIELTEIHRQAQGSAIITESIKVSNGEQLAKINFIGIETRGEMQDFILDIYNDRAESAVKVLKKFKELLDSGVSYEDIKVVTPMNTRGNISASILNNKIQKLIFNDKMPFVEKGVKENKYKLHVGDIIMCVKNNYKLTSLDGLELKALMNGDMGKIIKIYANGDIAIQTSNKGDILVPSEYTNNLKLAYACTCHKLQGSSAPYVIVVLDYSAYTMLSKEWLYTAITRAKKRCFLFAENNALRRAIRTSGISERNTFLKEFLEKESN